MRILQYALIRAGLALLTLLTVSIVIFALMELVPGDCAERYLAFKVTQGQDISVSEIAYERARLGLDRPMLTRWSGWIVNAFRGEFGDSCILRVSISQLLGDKFMLSLGMSLAALILAYGLALPIGIYSASAGNPYLDNGLRLVSYLGLALPNFLLALLIMLIGTFFFGNTLTGLFSAEFRDAPWSMPKFIDLLGHIWLPVIILGWSATAFALQTVRALMSDELGKLYVTAAAARGVSGRRLLWRYPARHAMGTIINSVGYDLNRIFSELPIIALILTLTEAGGLLIEALARSNDQQLAGAIIFLLTASIVTINFVTDMIMVFLDPRFGRSILEAK